MTKVISEEVRIKQINAIPNIKFIRWSGEYEGSRSRAVVRCSIDGYEWTPMIYSLINTGSRCPQCAGQRRWTADERVEQINSLDSIRFVRWHGDYSGSRSVAVVSCVSKNHKWKASVTDVVHNRTGCPECYGNKKITQQNAEERINEIKNVKFIRWSGEYKNSYSKATVMCEVDGAEWNVRASTIMNGLSGCPRCAKGGFDRSKVGTLYALRSDCGSYVKVGISNKPLIRYKQLRIATPFDFSVIEEVVCDGSKIADLERNFHKRYKSANLNGFQGCTEWLVCTDELLQDLRNTRDSLRQGV